MNLSLRPGASFSRAVLLLALIAHVVIAGVAWFARAHHGGDFFRYWTIATTTGRPYLDFQVDFPPGAFAVVKALSWSAPDLHQYESRLLVTNFLADAGIFASLCWGWGALAAGFDFARGDIVISMDGDYQHDPVDIPAFIEKIHQGYDIVSGWREKRVDNFVSQIGRAHV